MNQAPYVTLSEKYLRNAEDLLKKGDSSEAGELFWGATATLVKAAADRRGWRHTSHRDLRAAIQRIYEETGDTQFTYLFAAAERLHTNFYEDRYSLENVRAFADEVKRFIEKLKTLGS